MALQQRVALLMGSPARAQEISEIFRLVGVVPEYYDSLKSFWTEILGSVPVLCVIDVRLMGSGGLVLKNHPHVKSGRIRSAFFYEESTLPLLRSTFDLESCGYINGAVSLKGQIKVLLRRINQWSELRNQNEDLASRQRGAEKKIEHLVDNIEDKKAELYYREKFLKVREKIDDSKDHADFFGACATVLDSWEDVVGYACVELSPNYQKLVSPKLVGRKYRELPSLWLAKPCRNGIEFFAQNLANQVCLDVMGGNLMTLLIVGRGDYPDCMVFVQVEDEEFLSHFDWEALERSLISLHYYFCLRNEKFVPTDEKILSPWELLSTVDDSFFDVSQGEGRLALVGISFSKIVDEVRKDTNVRFYWGKFYNEFLSKLERNKKISFRASPMDPCHVIFVVEKEGFDAIFDGLKSFCESFPCWRYFEDSDSVIAADLQPSLKMIPLSSWAVFDYLSSETISVGSVSTAVRHIPPSPPKVP